MRKNYTKENVEQAILKNYSISECLRALGLRPVGSNYKTFYRLVKKYNIDISHFTGQGWSKGKTFDYSTRRIPLSEILIKDSNYNSNSLRKRLIKEGVKTHQCEVCLNVVWNGQLIPIELEHHNGDNTDNRIENLKILCPNCHAQTDHYRGRNKVSSRNERRELNRVKFGEPLTCDGEGNPEPSSRKREGVETLRREPKSSKICECGTQIHYNSKQCRDCERANRKTLRPPMQQLIQDFQELKSFVQVAKKYGVSDNGVRRWLKIYQIDEDTVKRKSSAQNENVVKTIV